MIPVSEAEWQRTVTDFAAVHRWRRAHVRKAVTATGQHMTPVAYEGKGLPDLLLVRERVVWVELKSEKGRLSSEQEEWLADLEAAGQEVYVWRPSMWDEVVATLSRVDGVGA